MEQTNNGGRTFVNFLFTAPKRGYWWIAAIALVLFGFASNNLGPFIILVMFLLMTGMVFQLLDPVMGRMKSWKVSRSRLRPVWLTLFFLAPLALMTTSLFVVGRLSFVQSEKVALVMRQGGDRTVLGVGAETMTTIVPFVDKIEAFSRDQTRTAKCTVEMVDERMLRADVRADLAIYPPGLAIARSIRDQATLEAEIDKILCDALKTAIGRLTFGSRLPLAVTIDSENVIDTERLHTTGLTYGPKAVVAIEFIMQY